MKSVDDRGQQEVERPESEHGEDVRREHDERIGCHAEDRWNRIDGEHEVGQLDEDQNEEQWCGQLAALLHDKKPLAVKIAGKGEQASCGSDNAILLAIELLVALDRH